MENNRIVIYIKEYFFAFLRWLLFGIAVGAVCGAAGACFSKSIHGAAQLRAEYPWLLYLLPAGGIVSVAVYKLCKVSGIGTDDVMESVRSEKTVPFLLAPSVFAATLISHLLGASAGKEGAALQLGGSVAGVFGKVFRLNEKDHHIITMCGMGALFASVFGTPLGACVFALEVIRVGHFCSAAFFPAMVSSVTAFGISQLLGVEAERLPVNIAGDFSFDMLWRVAVIAAVGAVVSIVFCAAIHYVGIAFEKGIKNSFFRAFVGGAIIVSLTVLVGTRDYNGGGNDVIVRIFEGGEFRYEAFALKILFTAITIAAGYKGGEIVPTFFIGATLGAALSVPLGLNPALGAAVGMAVLFCSVTNCPLATIIISVELFGSEGLIYYAFAAVMAFLLSGKGGLYHKQRFAFSKTHE